jgi:ABC-type polysaccharide/polyol phosphate transport system ATPase subunit
MDNIAVSIRSLSKMYRVHRSRPSRLLDFFGLRIGDPRRYFKEHWALHDVTLDIERGSTVGVIGRNGAGKSTLLKLLAGVSEPTLGTIKMNGQVSGLLELGTGFHPDLTGHENIYAGGLYLGLDHAAVDTLYSRIVAFAELGDALHQPVRTYSTGMYMRLAFSMAVCTSADIHLIDEVLGVGDAYFFGKCVQRFRELQRAGCAMIVVTHDHSLVLRLCSRCIWIDQGRIVADGSPLEVVMAYSQSIYEERDRCGEASKSAAGLDLRPAQQLRATEAVKVEDVDYLDSHGTSTRFFSMGQPLIVKVRYVSRVPVRDAIMAVVVSRTDGVRVFNAISSMDGVRFELLGGEDVMELVLDPPLLGPGEYMVAVGIYPSLDLSDAISTQHATLWHQSKTFTVQQPDAVVMDLGVVRHPVQWRLNGRVLCHIQSSSEGANPSRLR